MFDSDLTMGSARTQAQQHALMGLRRSVQMVNPIHFDKKSNPFGMPKSNVSVMKAAPQLRSQFVQTTLMWSFSELRGNQFD